MEKEQAKRSRSDFPPRPVTLEIPFTLSEVVSVIGERPQGELLISLYELTHARRNTIEPGGILNHLLSRLVWFQVEDEHGGVVVSDLPDGVEDTNSLLEALIDLDRVLTWEKPNNLFEEEILRLAKYKDALHLFAWRVLNSCALPLELSDCFNMSSGHLHPQVLAQVIFDIQVWFSANPDQNKPVEMSPVMITQADRVFRGAEALIGFYALHPELLNDQEFSKISFEDGEQVLTREADLAEIRLLVIGEFINLFGTDTALESYLNLVGEKYRDLLMIRDWGGAEPISSLLTSKDAE